MRIVVYCALSARERWHRRARRVDEHQEASNLFMFSLNSSAEHVRTTDMVHARVEPVHHFAQPLLNDVAGYAERAERGDEMFLRPERFRFAFHLLQALGYLWHEVVLDLSGGRGARCLALAPCGRCGLAQYGRAPGIFAILFAEPITQVNRLFFMSIKVGKDLRSYILEVRAPFTREALVLKTKLLSGVQVELVCCDAKELGCAGIVGHNVNRHGICTARQLRDRCHPARPGTVMHGPERNAVRRRKRCRRLAGCAVRARAPRANNRGML